MMKMIVSYGGYGDIVKYEVKDIDSLDFDVFRDWKLFGDNIWCEENDVIVVGESESECLENLKKFDSEFGGMYDVYEKVEGCRMCDWFLSLVSEDE